MEVLVFNLVQDVINSYVIVGKSMEEVLCIYYTTEMLYMLETLHDVGIIHGDFKPDDLLVRYSRWNLFFYIMDCDNVLQIVENLSFLDIIVTQKMGRLHLHPEHHRIERVIFGCCETIKTEM